MKITKELMWNIMENLINIVVKQFKLIVITILIIIDLFQAVYIDNLKKTNYEYKVRVKLYDTIMTKQVIINDNFINSYSKHFLDTLQAIYGKPKFVKYKGDKL